MPFVRIDLNEGRPAEFRRTLGDIVYAAMRATIDVPENDKFQVITQHKPGALNIAPSYLGNSYTAGIVLIQITLSRGRSQDKKKALYRKIAEDLHAGLGIRKEDVFINLVEVTPEDWSFGGGIAQYVQ